MSRLKDNLEHGFNLMLEWEFAVQEGSASVEQQKLNVWMLANRRDLLTLSRLAYDIATANHHAARQNTINNLISLVKQAEKNVTV